MSATDRLITPDAYHAGHVLPLVFQQLVVDWLAECSIRFGDIEVTLPADNQHVAQIINEAQRYDWQQYHERHAILRLLSPVGNLSAVKIEKSNY